MKRNRVEMIYAVLAASKVVRAGFTEAANVAVEEAVSKVRSKSEIRRTRDVKEAARVAKDDSRRRRSQEEVPGGGGNLLLCAKFRDGKSPCCCCR